MTSIRKAQDIKVLKNGTAGQAALKAQYISGSAKVEKDIDRKIGVFFGMTGMPSVCGESPRRA